MAMVLATTAGMAAAMPSAAMAQSASARSFDIPAQALPDALILFGRQAGVEVTAEAANTRGRSTRGIKGSLPPAQALSQLLAGTGLTFRWMGDHTVMVEPAPQTAEGAIQLGPVRIEGETGRGNAGYAALSSDGAATEGTRSYTTKAPSGTATGLGLTPRETPQSLSIITRERMDDQQLLTISEVMAQTPGITLGLSGGERVTFYSRGGSITSYQYDGVMNQSDSTTRTMPQTVQDMAQYDRIEVLRGATGLMTGAGDPGGVVNFIRKRPTRDFQAYVQGSIGSWDLYRGEADISGPLVKGGAIRARVVGMAQRDDSFMDFYGHKRGLIYGVVEADVTSTTLLRGGMSYQKYDAHGAPGVPVLYSDGTRTDFPRSTSSGAYWDHDKSDTYTYFAALEQKLPHGWTFKIGAEHMHVDREGHSGSYLFTGGLSRLNRDGSTTIDRGYYFPTQKQNNLTVTLGGPFELLGRMHDFIAGYNYNDYKNFHPTFRDGQSNAINFFTWKNNTPEGEPTERSIYMDIRYKQKAGYAAARLSPVDGLSVILGGRVTDYDYSYYLESFIAGTVTRTTKRIRGEFTPYAGVVLDLTREQSLYASYTDIFQPQSTQDRNGELLPPVVGRNYEIGWKGAFADGKLTSSIALFQVERDNLGVVDVGYTVPGTTNSAYRAAKGARTKGLDLELAGEILPGWNMTASYSHERTKDASGSRLNTERPSDTVKFWSTYRFPVAGRALTLGGGASWNGKSSIYFSRYDVTVKQEAYVVANLMARYEATDNLSISVNVNNLFDKTYFASLQAAALYGTPRSVLGSVRYRF